MCTARKEGRPFGGGLPCVSSLLSKRSVQETARGNASRPAISCLLPVPAESALADDGQDDWSANKIVYTVDPADDGSYTVEADSTIAVESITDIYGQPVTDYTVAYFKGDNAATATITGSAATQGETLDKRTGGMPGEEGEYFIVVFEGSVDLSTATAGTSTIANIAQSGNYTAQAFEVVAKADSIEGAFAFEYDKNAEKKGISDESWQYNGDAMNLGIALGNKILKQGTDFDIEWTSLPVGVQPSDISFSETDGANKYSDDIVNAGTYTAKLTGKDDYKGTATVTFTVDAIDLTADSIAIAPQETTMALTQVGSAGNYVILDNTEITVNGKALASGAEVTATLTKVNGDASKVSGSNSGDYTELGRYTFEITPTADAGANVEGAKKTVDALLVTDVVDYTYGGTAIVNGESIGTFNPSMNLPFDPQKIAANNGAVGYTYTVTNAEGDQVSSYDEPGEYSIVIDTPLTANWSRVGHVEATFTVVSNIKEYAEPLKLFVSVDGKAISGAAGAATCAVEYDKEAVTPLVAVTSDGTKLAEGEDFAVAYEDADGNAVDSIVDPGTYAVVATLNDGLDPHKELRQALVVSKADILSAEASADFFATDGETAAAPSFVGYTKTNCKGLEFELASDQISVKYYTDYVDSDDDKVLDELQGEVDADELTEKGWYWAQINIMTNAKYVENAANVDLVVPFQVLKTANFADVPSDAWYAESVYKASQNGFMEGVASGIFAPERTMTRAEFAQTVYNMAHKLGEQGANNAWETYPTQFSDVEPNAWYAKAVEWAARYGIVTGKSATTFDPNGTVTREEIATMLYRYIGNGAKADASVLDRFEDKAEVCDWAVDAMAWAVEEGVVNGVSETSLAPHGDAQRCMVAAMAVRAQPENIDNM